MVTQTVDFFVLTTVTTISLVSLAVFVPTKLIASQRYTALSPNVALVTVSLTPTDPDPPAVTSCSFKDEPRSVAIYETKK